MCLSHPSSGLIPWLECVHAWVHVSAGKIPPTRAEKTPIGGWHLQLEVRHHQLKMRDIWSDWETSNWKWKPPIWYPTSWRYFFIPSWVIPVLDYIKNSSVYMHQCMYAQVRENLQLQVRPSVRGERPPIAGGNFQCDFLPPGDTFSYPLWWWWYVITSRIRVFTCSNACMCRWDTSDWRWEISNWRWEPLIGDWHLQLDFLSPGGIFHTIWCDHYNCLHQEWYHKMM